MPKKRKPDSTCPLCRVEHESGVGCLVHILVAHGPLAAASPQKRRRVKARLPRLHRRLEEMGFGEAEAHKILQAVQEELRRTGVV